MNTVIQWHVILFTVLLFVIASFLYPLYAWRYASQYAQMPEVEEISNLIKNGARAYLSEQWKFLIQAVTATVVLGGLVVNYYNGFTHAVVLCAGFVVGGFFTALAGDIAMRISTTYAPRVVYGAYESPNKGMDEALISGSLTAWYVCWSSLVLVLTFASVVVITKVNPIFAMIGLCLGSSFTSALAKLAGGIFTKGADVGADLVGKLELGLSEDDRQNPAVIADNVGDNVGDCAGMAMDQFESRVLALSLVLILCNTYTLGYVLFLISVGLLSGMFAFNISNIEIKTANDVNNTVYYSLLTSSLITAGFATFYCLMFDLHEYILPTFSGLALNLIMITLTRYATDSEYSDVNGIIEAAKSGHGTAVIEGLAVGLKYPIFAILAIVLPMIVHQNVFLIPIAMLSQSFSIITQDAFGPVSDNAGGIAEMNHLDDVRKTTDIYDAAGNSIKAMTKGYSLTVMIFLYLLVISMFQSMLSHIGLCSINLFNIYVTAGLLTGAMITSAFAGFSLQAVRIAGGKVVDEIRQQTSNMVKGKFVPDYNRTITLLTKESINIAFTPFSVLLIFPAMFASLMMIAPYKEVICFTLGTITGALITGSILSMFLMISGGAWDNAKKYLEKIGRKGTPEYHAAVTGDTVGDPCKDTAGPALIPAIKFIMIIGLTMFILSLPYMVVNDFLITSFTCAIIN